jgi:GNAT superfamily N-acetyltransferase
MISVRRAVPGDLEEMVGLLGVLFSLEADFRPDPARQRRGLLRMLEDAERRLVLVAVAEGRVVGMVTVQLLVSTAEGGDSGLLEDLVVEERCRAAGVGSTLLAEAERWARARGASRMQLLADRENEPALRFYARRAWASSRMVCLRRMLRG